ncbi:MAG TPA: GxxExxY protein [bacterium]|nr:GxxExxY protein [bacterium]
MEQNKITENIIGGCINVHKELGPGLLESIYESALCIEFDEIGLKYQRQKSLPVTYKNKKIGDFRIDLLVEDSIVLELKSVERFDPIFEAQILSYMKLGDYKVGLLINFNSKLLKDGIKRFII